MNSQSKIRIVFLTGILIGTVLAVSINFISKPNYHAVGPNDLYLNLMKLSLTDLIYENSPKGRVLRVDGGNWPSRALTMIGLKRLDNLHFVVEDVIAKGIPGDMIETVPSPRAQKLSKTIVRSTE